jgi:hypothetical protein
VSRPTQDTAGGVHRAAPAPKASGWFAFAGALMIMLGLFNVIMGVVALVNRTYYVVGPQGLLILDIRGWGWVHLIVGALIVLTGFALFTGSGWARVVAALLAGFNALAQLAFLSAQPLWSTIVIVLDVLVIWAVVVHRTDAEAEAVQ